MRRQGRLSTKFLLLSLLLLAVALVSIGLTLWATRQLDGGAAAVNEAGRMRMQAWRLVAAVELERSGVEVDALVEQFDRSLLLLRDGDVSRPLAVPWDQETRALYRELVSAWQTVRQQTMDGRVADATATMAAAEVFVARVDRFVSTIEHRMERLTAWLNLFQLAMVALAVAGAVLLLYVGNLFVVRPLERLQQALGRVEAGDFAARVDVDTRDEFGDLAAGFNHMAATLETMYEGLEQRVRAKTHSLEAQRARLSALYEMSTFLAGGHGLEKLAEGFATRMRQFSRCDAVAIRWSDEAQQRFLMLASDCLPKEMVDEERCVLAGSCACGQVGSVQGSRVIPIRAEEGTHFGHCARAGFNTLVTVPIRAQQRLLGEVDLFYRGTHVPTTEERALFESLASHLGIAIENLRTEALLRENAASEERAMLARELHDSIAQALVFLKIQLGLLRAALDRRDAPAVTTALEELEAGIQESTADVRELLVHFRTRTNSEDIEQALRQTLNKFQHQSGVAAHLEVRGHGVALPPDVQLQVLHVVQEALSNVRKHARASAVWLTVDKEPHWAISVRDDGQGFDWRAPSVAQGHVGLQIMRERADRIGARVDIESRPGEGSRVLIELPA